MTNEIIRMEVLRLVAKRRLSYAVIGEMFSLTRGQVAGIVFRDKHKGKLAARSPQARNSYNKMGHGWQAPSYQPVKNAANTR